MTLPTLPTFSVRGRRHTGVPRRSRWVLVGTLLVLAGVFRVATRPTIPTERVGTVGADPITDPVIATTDSPGRTGLTRVSWPSWWVHGAIVGLLLVAVSLVAWPSPPPAGGVAAAQIADSALIAVPTTATTTTSGAASPRRTADADRLTEPEAIATTTGIAPIAPAAPSVTANPLLPTPSPRASTLARSEPTRVRISAIQLDSELIPLGLQDDGRMEVPDGAFPAGWYTGAPTPGELGPAILAGHVDYGGHAGVFHRLRDLKPGDTVEVTRHDASTAVFLVTHVQQHRKDAFPTAAVYGDIDHAGLRLITCGGEFDRRVNSYEDNIVVFAELINGIG